MSIRKDVTVYTCDKCGKNIIGDYNKTREEGRFGKCVYDISDPALDAQLNSLEYTLPAKPIIPQQYTTFSIPIVKQLPAESVAANDGSMLVLPFEISTIERGYCAECFEKIQEEYLEQIKNFNDWAVSAGVIAGA